MSLADAVITRMLAQRDLLRSLDEQIRSVSVRVTSPDRAVIVTVDAYGAMTGLMLSQGAFRHGAQDLGVLIVATAHAAANIASQRQRVLVARFHEEMTTLEATPIRSDPAA